MRPEPDLERRCPGCDARVQLDALFCGSCGQELEARPEVSPAQMRALRSRHHSLAVRFAPVLLLWVLLLVVVVCSGLVGMHSGMGVPGALALQMALMASLILQFCWADREHIAPLLLRSGFTRRTWWLAPAWFLGLAAFFAAYFGALEALLGIPRIDPFK